MSELLIGIIVAGIGGGTIGAIIVAISGRQQRQTDVTDTVTGMFDRLAEGLRKELDRTQKDLAREREAREREKRGMEARLQSLETKYRVLRRHNELLVAQIIDLGFKPAAMPDE